MKNNQRHMEIANGDVIWIWGQQTQGYIEYQNR